MFYSHQLLSKKGPFGHIWIAATMRPKMNRKRTEQVDIQESCMQIINPVVPLALRLSGILMGGIVRIYHDKVRFFYDDVNEFMIKMQTKPAAKNVDSTVLSHRKSRARFEAITKDFSEDFHEFEHAMFEPETPQLDDEELFTVPPPAKTESFNKFQADSEDITLDEDSVRSFTTGLGDIEREESDDKFQQPENFMDVDDMDMRFEAKFQAPEDVLDPISEEPTGERVKVDKAPKAETPISPESQKPRKRRKVSKKNNKIILDEETTQIPQSVFRAWQEDTSSIIYRRDRRKCYTDISAERARTMLNSPSTFLSFSSRSRAPRSLLPTSLMEMWKTNVCDEQDPAEGRTRKRRAGKSETPEAAKDRGQESPVDDPADMPPADMPESFDIPEGYGSIEKLRAAVETPLTGSQDHFMDNQMGFTPTFSASAANSGMTSKQWSSPKLVPDAEVDFPTSGRSKKSRRSDKKSSMSPLGFDIPNNDFFPNSSTPDIPVVSQFESEPTQSLTQQELDKLTMIMLQYLREHFTNTPGIKTVSLNSITEGMEASQAARMFFHICVLSTNRYLAVKQTEAYGDIMIGRGGLF